MATTSTKIQWTDATWNVVRGCARVSPGCENCYAERTAYRFNGKGQPYDGLTVLGKHGPRWSGEARFVPSALEQPLRWRAPRRIFVNSMSDLFHDYVTNEQIAAVFGVMAASPRHTFQILTKRPERMAEWFKWLASETSDDREPPPSVLCGIEAANRGADVDYLGLPASWPLPNVWLGVSCEDQKRADERIPHLLNTPAVVRFVSAEPLLGPVDLRKWLCCTACANDWGGQRPAPDNLVIRHCANPQIDWVIVGGESGPRARPCNVVWVRDIVEQCRSAGTAAFVKQLGSRPHEPDYCETGSVSFLLKDRKGGEISEWPRDLKVRQFPEVRS